MRLNLAQMQAVQRAFESFDMVMENHGTNKSDLYGLRPVFKYNGHLIMGNLYDLDKSRIPSEQPKIVEFKAERKDNVKDVVANSENSVSKSYNFFSENLYKSILNKPLLAFDFVASKLPEWEKSEALPTKFIKNIKCLDGSIDDSINFVTLNSPVFEWVSLASRN